MEQYAWIKTDAMPYRIVDGDNAEWYGAITKHQTVVNDRLIPLSTSEPNCYLVPVPWVSGKQEGDIVQIASRVFRLSQQQGQPAVKKPRPFEEVLASVLVRSHTSHDHSLNAESEVEHLLQYLPPSK